MEAHRRAARAGLVRTVQATAIRADVVIVQTGAGSTPTSGRVAARRHVVRPVVGFALVVIGALLVPVALSSVWLQYQLLDTDRFVAAGSSVAADPAVQREVSNQVSDALLTELDQVSGLPLSQIAPGVTRSAVRSATRSVIASDSFQSLWESALRSAHSDVVALADGKDGSALALRRGRVVLDLDSFVDAVVARLPAPLAAALPASTTGDNIVLLDREDTSTVSGLFGVLDDLGYWVPLAVVGLFAGGIAVDVRRRRTVGVAAAGIVITCGLGLGALAWLRVAYLGDFGRRSTRDAMAALFDAVFDSLRDWMWIVVALGVATLGAVVVIELLQHDRSASDQTAEGAGERPRGEIDTPEPAVPEPLTAPDPTVVPGPGVVPEPPPSRAPITAREVAGSGHPRPAARPRSDAGQPEQP